MKKNYFLYFVLFSFLFINNLFSLYDNKLHWDISRPFQNYEILLIKKYFDQVEKLPKFLELPGDECCTFIRYAIKSKKLNILKIVILSKKVDINDSDGGNINKKSIALAYSLYFDSNIIGNIEDAKIYLEMIDFLLSQEDINVFDFLFDVAQNDDSKFFDFIIKNYKRVYKKFDSKELIARFKEFLGNQKFFNYYLPRIIEYTGYVFDKCRLDSLDFIKKDKKYNILNLLLKYNNAFFNLKIKLREVFEVSLLLFLGDIIIKDYKNINDIPIDLLDSIKFILNSDKVDINEVKYIIDSLLMLDLEDLADFFIKNFKNKNDLIFYDQEQIKEFQNLIDKKENNRVINNFLSNLFKFNIKDNNGNNLLHNAVLMNNLRVIKLILAKYPNLIFIKNNQNKIPIEIAVHRPEILQFFIDIAYKLKF